MPPGDGCDLLCLDLPKAEALRRRRPGQVSLERIAARAKALSDPTRLLIALVLQDTDEACVCDVAWTVERSDKLVSHHLQALRSAGLVRSRRDGKMVMYELTDDGRLLLEAFASRTQAIRT